MKRLILVPVLLLAFCKKKEMVEEQPEPEPAVVYQYTSVSKVPNYAPKDYRDSVYFTLKVNGTNVSSQAKCTLCSITSTNVNQSHEVKKGDKVQLILKLVSFADLDLVKLGISKATVVNKATNQTSTLIGDSNFNVTARDTVIGADSAVVASNTWEFVIP